ncbi:MAG: preprotein translocase subunit SecY [Spirochaetes bacterium]|nr:preprotein translocase subunit SecY [Spirochaetota bacterium]
MIEKIINIFRVPELRKRVLFTIGILIVFRIGAHIPTPGIDVVALHAYFVQHASGLLNLIDMFSGGALLRFTVFALGVMPYISASIIMQLLTVAIPYLEKLSKEGDAGRKKINQYSRYLTVLVCIVQSFGLSAWMKSMYAPNGAPVVPDPGLGFTLMTILTLTTGTILLMWMGERITESGIGNGVSLIIFAGIVARVPASVMELVVKVKMGEFNPVFLLVVGALFMGIVAFIIIIEQGQRRIPVQYAQRIMGRRVYGAQTTHIPLKINPSGVMPIIFASAIILFPGQIASFLGNKIPFFNYIALLLAPDSVGYMVLYSILIIFFTYFYTAIVFNPKDLAENMRKFGGFIPGIRPGQNTSEYIERTLNRILIPGSISLAFVAIFPSIVNVWLGIPSQFAQLMGGTSLLIMVGVDLDTMKQIESHLVMRHYDGFLKKGKLKGRWL